MQSKVSEYMVLFGKIAKGEHGNGLSAISLLNWRRFVVVFVRREVLEHPTTILVGAMTHPTGFNCVVHHSRIISCSL